MASGLIQFSSVAQSCPTVCDPMNCSTPVLPVHHQILEYTQTHVHRVSDAIQPSHPLSSPSPPAPNPYFMANRTGKCGSSDIYTLLGLSNHCSWCRKSEDNCFLAGRL